MILMLPSSSSEMVCALAGYACSRSDIAQVTCLLGVPSRSLDLVVG